MQYFIPTSMILTLAPPEALMDVDEDVSIMLTGPFGSLFELDS